MTHVKHPPDTDESRGAETRESARIEAMEAVLNAVSTIERREAEYDKANAAMRALDLDFPPRVNFIDGDVWSSIMRLLCAASGGDDTAKYYLEECRTMKGGGRIIESDGSEWPIRNVADLKTYLLHVAALRAAAEFDRRNG